MLKLSFLILIAVLSVTVVRAQQHQQLIITDPDPTGFVGLIEIVTTPEHSILLSTDACVTNSGAVDCTLLRTISPTGQSTTIDTLYDNIAGSGALLIHEAELLVITNRASENQSVEVRRYDLSNLVRLGTNRYAVDTSGTVYLRGGLLDNGFLYIYGQFSYNQQTRGSASYIQKIDIASKSTAWEVTYQSVPGSNNCEHLQVNQAGDLLFSRYNKPFDKELVRRLELVKVDAEDGKILSLASYIQGNQRTGFTELQNGNVALFFEFDPRNIRIANDGPSIMTLNASLDSILDGVELYNNAYVIRSYEIGGVQALASGSIVAHGSANSGIPFSERDSCSSDVGWMAMFNAGADSLRWLRVYQFNEVTFNEPGRDNCRYMSIESIEELDSGMMQVNAHLSWLGDGDLLASPMIMRVDTFGCLIDQPCESKIIVNEPSATSPSMLSPGYVWNQAGSFGFPASTVLRYRISQEPTDLEGQRYYQVETSPVESGDLTWTPLNEVYLREEKGKVYSYAPGRDDDFKLDNDDLLYDFTLEVGDTFHTPNFSPFKWTSGGQISVVTEVDSVTLINGERRKRLTLRCRPPGTGDLGSPYQWIDGMGSIDGMFESLFICSFDAYGPYLLCYSLNGETLYNNESSCVESPLSIRPSKSSTYRLQLYPNPTTDILTVKGVMSPFRLQVYDLMGRLVQHHPHHSTAEIDISILRQGVYILEITESSGTRFIAQVVKR